MTKIPSWRRYLTFWRTPIVQDVDDELRFHTNMRVKEYMARGFSEDEARRAVAERLGDIHAAQSECVELTEVRERNARSAAFFDALRNDLRYAVRGLRARPGFAAAIIVTLGLGIGANAAVFSVVDRLLFRTAPMLRDVSRTHLMYVLYPTPDGGGGHFTLDKIPYLRYKQVSGTSGSFVRTAAFGVDHSVVGAAEDGREMQVAGVTPGFFGFFDAPPRLGRYFNDREDLPPGGEPVVVLSYAMWQTQFGGRDDVLGAKIQIGQTYTVIGVAPRWFAGLWPNEPPVAYIPFAAYAAATNNPGRGETWWTSKDLEIAGMLMTRKPGVPVEMAATDLTHQMRVRWDENKDTRSRNQPTALLSSTLADRGPQQSDIGQVGALVGAMALVVLLIAGANVANLLLARALRRRREIAVRLALGISRRRLVSQLLTETLLLAALGGVTGLIVARWGGPALRAKFVTTTADTSVVTDLRTLIFVGLVAVIAGVATGLAPAWQAGRLDVTRFLRIGAREGTLQRSRLRASLLVVQGALSVLLLIAAGLFVRSLNEARHLHMGYDVDQLLMVQTNMRGVRLDSAQSQDLWRNLTTASRTLPGVERAAAGWAIPLRDLIIASIKRPPEMDSLQFARLPLMLQNIVTPGFFETMGTRILRGRAIDSTDAPGSPRAVVVSNRFAQAFWPGQDAIGRCVMNARGVCRYVVGVAEDIRNGWTNENDVLQVYASASQSPLRNGQLFVRIHGTAEPYAEKLRAVLQREMPGASYVTVTPYADIVGDALKSWQLGATVFVAFGVLAMVLAAIGLYSMISYNVTQRTHEMGVRRALGAQSADVIRLVMRQGVLLGGIGVLLGGALAYGAARRIEPMLFRISAHDPLVFAFVVITMLAVAVAASFFPARRAASVDPNVALRSE